MKGSKNEEYMDDVVEDAVRKCVQLIRAGYSRAKILNKLSGYEIKFKRQRLIFDLNDIYEIAKCRIKIKDKFSVKNLYFDEYGLRYSTPEIIGRYRAQKIRDLKIADVSCGAGMQAIFYSFTNERVVGFDINPKRVEFARRNAVAYGATNVKFHVGNCFSSEVIDRTKNFDVIFSDPARKESEPERSLETLIPSPVKIIEKYGADRDYIFDLPPQISKVKIPDGWEKEYISVNHKIKRLTVYTNSLYKHDRVAVSLPQGEMLVSDEPDYVDLEEDIGDYIYVVDEAIYYGELFEALKKSLNESIWYVRKAKRRSIASSSALVKSAFLEPYRVLGISKDLSSSILTLKENNAGKVTLRMDIQPESYWITRKKIESELKGSKHMYLFQLGRRYVTAEKCNIT